MKKSLALLVISLFSIFTVTESSYAFVLTDWVNYIENCKILAEEIMHTKQNIEQYKNMLLRYKNMVLNSARPDKQIWSNIQSLTQELQQASYRYQQYTRQLGGMEAYAKKFADYQTYQKIKLLDPNGDGAKQVEEQRAFASQAQKQATDAMLQTTEQQQKSIEKDAQQIDELQQAARAADGQLAAASYNNQLAGQQNKQLLQIRNLLTTQQAAEATKMRADATRQAQEDATMKQFFSGKIESNHKEW